MPEITLDPETLDRLRRLTVALAIGLLIGVERGWKDRSDPEGERTAGLRTFALIGLLGGVLGLLGQEISGVVLALGLFGFALVMGAFELQHARRRGISDATPVVAALVTVALGALAGLGHLQIAAAAAVAVAIILAFKKDLHVWLERVTFEELTAGLVLAAMTVIVLPLLPSEPIDPWGALSLRAVWLLTVLISAVSFVGYAAIRIAGSERGPLIAGLAGGLVSSTATVVSFARMARTHAHGAQGLVAGAVAANMMMFARVGVVASVLRSDLAVPLAAALAPATATSAVLTAWLAYRNSPDGEKREGADAVIAIRNPLALGAAVTFGALLAVVSLAAAVLEAWFGAQGVFVVAAVSGIADADAIMLSMTQAARTTADVAALAILVATAVNTAAKAVMAHVAGGARVGRVMIATSAVALAAGAGGYLAYMRLA